MTSWAFCLLGLCGFFSLLGLRGLRVCYDFLGFAFVRTSWALRLLGLLGLLVCLDFLGFASFRTSLGFRLLGLLGLFVSCLLTTVHFFRVC